jgi:cell filamentation protein
LKSQKAGMGLDKFVDPYLDNNKVLKNLVNAKTDAELLEAEALFIYFRTIEFAEMDIAFGINKFDLLKELQNIHRHLFQDIFDWAGKIRGFLFTGIYDRKGIGFCDERVN